ncbi:MAG: hypothetical protein ABSF32_12065 [Ignavibacteria bacterium]|jgi:hypothetical protein
MNENNIKDLIEISGIELNESSKINRSGSKYRCVIIKAGLTNSANAFAELDGRKVPIYKNYTENVLKEAVEKGLFENVPALFRTEEEHLRGTNTGVNRIVGIFTDVKWNDERKQVEGIFNLSKGSQFAEAFRKKLNKAWRSAKHIGLSISGLGKYVIEKLKDRYIAVVTQIESLQSVDPVPLGNAGGRLISLIEGSNSNHNNSNNIKKEKNMNPELKQKIFDLISEAMRLDSDDSGSDSINDVVTEAKKLLCEAQLQNALTRSKLPWIVKEKVRKQFEGKIFEQKELEDAMKLEQKILAELNPAVIDNGGADNITVTQDAVDKAEKQLEYMLLSPLAKSKLTEAEKQEYANSGASNMFSVKEWYRSVTGDYHVTGMKQNGRGVLSEALITTDFASIFKNALNKSMVKEYNFSAYNESWRKLVSEIVPRQDFKTNTVARMGGYANLPVVNENAAYTAAASPTDEEITYNIRKRGYLETITREMIVNDDLGAIRKIPIRMGQAAARTIYEFVFDLIITNPVMDYDGVALFHASHGGNLLTAALSDISFSNARSIMRNQTELDSGKKIGIKPKYLLVPGDLDKTAYELTTTAFGLNNPVPAFHQTWQIEPITIAHTTDANNWYLLADPMEYPTIEIGFLHGMEEPELFVSDLPTQGSYFTNDQIRYKIRHEYDGDVLDHRSFVGAIVA